MGRLIVISGPSGAGKGTLIACLLERSDRFRVATSATTRPRRHNEIDGREYHFLSDAEFQARVDRNEFLEHVSYAGGRYGTLRSEVEDGLASGHDAILELEVDGAVNVRRRRPDSVSVFIDPPTFEDLERRLRARATDSAGEISMRLEIAREQLEARDSFDLVVVNDDRERAADELLAMLEGVPTEGNR
ncbi:MAG: guanylate kinase [Gaiellales bacterium]|nr:guanylate kinase [Gaiellales bacterium]